MYLSQNRFIPVVRRKTRFSAGKSLWTKSFADSFSLVSGGGIMMDPFYREAGESGHAGRGRTQHLGADITGSVAGDGSIRDPRRGLPVYATVHTHIPISELNAVRAYNKNSKASMTGVGLQGSGNADMTEAKIFTQPWSSTEDHSYGGVLGMSCIYSYMQQGGTTAQFTLYIEFLHLITEQFLPKDKSGRIATLAEWQDTGRGIGFGPEMKNNTMVEPNFFLGPSYSTIGYLGATQSPHVHVQVAYFDRKTFDKNPMIRINPTLALY
jgi:hypothetical protein